MGNFIRGMARRGARAKQGPVHVADSGQAEMMDDNTAGPSLPAAEREEMGKSTGASRMFSRIPSFGKRSKSQSDMGTEATKTSTRKRTPFSFRRNRAQSPVNIDPGTAAAAQINPTLNADQEGGTIKKKNKGQKITRKKINKKYKKSKNTKRQKYKKSGNTKRQKYKKSGNTKRQKSKKYRKNH